MLAALRRLKHRRLIVVTEPRHEVEAACQVIRAYV
jgi:hypothetical protein